MAEDVDARYDMNVCLAKMTSVDLNDMNLGIPPACKAVPEFVTKLSLTLRNNLEERQSKQPDDR